MQELPASLIPLDVPFVHLKAIEDDFVAFGWSTAVYPCSQSLC